MSEVAAAGFTAARFQLVSNELKNRLFEMDETIEAAILALLSKSHVCFIGLPGCAKSLVVNELSKRVIGLRYFSRLVGKTTIPDELFGPYRLTLLEQDILERNTTGKLPEAEAAFVDEVFKTSSAILNSLLRIMNERLFENDGKIQPCPLMTMFGASNEMPADDSLGALWDRFLVRRVVEYAREDSSFLGMLRARSAGNAYGEPAATVTIDELRQAQLEVRQVSVPNRVFSTMLKIKNELTKIGIVPSPRRWADSVPLIQAKAWFNGRSSADVDDLMPLVDVLWVEVDQISKVRKVVTDIVQPDKQQVIDLFNAARVAWDEFSRLEAAVQVARAGEYGPKIKKAGEQMRKVIDKLTAESRSTWELDPMIQQLRTWHRELIAKISGEV